jgi:DNA excision repair protein ERCC-2
VLGVTELFSAREHAHGFGDRGGALGRRVGRALHARHQHAEADADPGYRAEVALGTRLAHGDWDVALRGRADAVRPLPGGALRVEELKTFWDAGPRAAHFDGAPAPPRVRAAARRQVRVYAWLLGLETDARVEAEVVWLEAVGDAVHRERVPVDPTRVARAVRAALEAWVERLEADRARLAARREVADRIRLPHAGWREGQRETAESVERALAGREQLLVEAPTGFGKTIAVLTPVLRYALREGKRVLFLSATGLGQRAALDALRALAPAALPTAVRLRARAALCPHERPLCHEAACGFARTHADALARHGLPAACFAGAPVLSAEAWRETALAAGACPFALSLDAAREAVVTVGDLNYAFDPEVRLLAHDDPALADTILVADEVHRVAPRVRDALGATLDAGAVRRAGLRAALSGAPVHREQAALCEALAARIEACAAEQLPGVPPGPDPRAGGDPPGPGPRAGGDPAAGLQVELEAELPEDLLDDLRPRLDLALLATLAYRRATGAIDADEPFLEVWLAARRFEEALRAPHASFASTAGLAAGHAFVRRLCVDPSPWIRPVIEAAHAFVGLSATLAPRELREAELGLSPERRAIHRAPDPFGPAQRRLVIDPSVDTRHRAREREAPRIAARLAALAQAVPGSTLALLPSHAALARVRERLPALDRPLAWQRPDDAESERETLLRDLAEGPPGLVLAVAGGVLAESVDLPPGALSAVAVVGPCLPPPTLARRLLEAHYETEAGCGFAWAYLAPAMARVLQAAGRLVRSPRHRGVVALLGRRFLREPYRSALPGSWLAGESPEAFAGDAAEAARAFFASATTTQLRPRPLAS